MSDANQNWRQEAYRVAALWDRVGIGVFMRRALDELAAREAEVERLKAAWPHRMECRTRWCEHCGALHGCKHLTTCRLAGAMVFGVDCAECACDRDKQIEDALKNV